MPFGFAKQLKHQQPLAAKEVFEVLIKAAGVRSHACGVTALRV
jgi:hypothetical protein